MQEKREIIKFENKRNKAIFYGIFFFACALIFFRIGSFDSLNDGSHYSSRAASYTDYILPNNQTTPMQWFGEAPWWGVLSFHDAPPLVFIIQHAVFRLFGENTFTMRFPFAVAGLGSIVLLFFIVRKLHGEKTALLSAGILSISTFFIWSARIAYLEGITTFFILLAMWSFLLFLEKEKYWFLFGVSLGLAFLAKYTAFFLIPFIFLYLIFSGRRRIAEKQLLLSLGIAVVVFSPVIVYNILMYKTRGHFDVQFSHLFSAWMFEAAQKDWPILFTKQESSTRIFTNALAFFTEMKAMFSFPWYVFLFASSIAGIVVAFWKKRNCKECIFFPLAFISIYVMFLFLPVTTRYLPIAVPILAGIAGWMLMLIFQRGKKHKKVLAVALLALMAYEALYNVNTNIVFHAYGETSAHFSAERQKSLGFNELNEYLSQTWEDNAGFRRRARRILREEDLAFRVSDLNRNNIYLYNFDIDWFGRVWYFQRNALYHGLMYVTDTEFGRAIGYDTNMFLYLKNSGVKSVYYIFGEDKSVLTPGFEVTGENAQYREFLRERFIEYIDSFGDGEVVKIQSPVGAHAFTVYSLNLKNISEL